MNILEQRIRQDLNRFFNIYHNRIEGIVAPLPQTAKEELDKELDLLRISIETRLNDLGV